MNLILKPPNGMTIRCIGIGLRQLQKRLFISLLYPGGYLAIADLYREDGSFHGENFAGHKGFDLELLTDLIRKLGFTNIIHRQCFIIRKKISESETKQFGVFLLVANPSTAK
jgi:hypothetical protein